MIGFLAAGVVGATAAYFILSGGTRERLVLRRARALAGGRDGLTAMGAAVRRPLADRLANPLLGQLAAIGYRITPAGMRASLELRLSLAGLHGPAGRQAVLALWALAWVAGILAGWAAGAVRPALGMVVGGSIVAAGILLPRIALDARIRGRRQAVTQELPDALDLLTSCVEAGMGFDAAALRVSSRPTRRPSPLQEELSHYLTDVRLGRSRPEALQDLAGRTGVPDLATVTSALIQADQLGVGVTSVLRAQAAQLRTRRRQRAQAAALQAPVKMMFPLVFFIFPAMFVVTLGPAALRMIDTFTKVGPG